IPRLERMAAGRRTRDDVLAVGTGLCSNRRPGNCYLSADQRRSLFINDSATNTAGLISLRSAGGRQRSRYNQGD
ncbi:MAG TPA: hypothetical protein VKA25_04495, partial [Gemmatimonadales bacterium]|nr:hypothetical protein [Gemmatimonadales bacterium]